MISPVLHDGISGAVVRSLGHSRLSHRRLRSWGRSLWFLSFIGDKSVLLGYLSEVSEVFDLLSAGFLVLDILHSVDVIVPLDLLDHDAARLDSVDVLLGLRNLWNRPFCATDICLNYKIKLYLVKIKSKY